MPPGWPLNPSNNKRKTNGLHCNKGVNASREKLAWDQLFDNEPFTHLKRLR